MGLLADLRAMKEVTRIKSGGIAKLSMSQITCLVTNMSDAKKNLSYGEFSKVNALFKEFRKCNTKIEMDVEGYLETAQKIIQRFDAIAPYEKYGGANELEFSFMMEDMREAFNNSNEVEEALAGSFTLKEKDYAFIDEIVKESMGQITKEDGEDLMQVLLMGKSYGKDKALNEFDKLFNNLLAKYEYFNVIMKISYMSGLLYPSGIVSREESDEIGKKYTENVMNKMQST